MLASPLGEDPDLIFFEQENKDQAVWLTLPCGGPDFATFVFLVLMASCFAENHELSSGFPSGSALAWSLNFAAGEC